MTFDDALYQKLVSLGIVGDEVYRFGQSPANVSYPYLTFQRISTERVRHLRGGAGLAAPRYQIDIWSTDALEVESAGRLLRMGLDNLRVSTFGSGAEAVEVRVSFVTDEMSTAEPPIDATLEGVHRWSVDVDLWIPESITP